MRKAVMVSDAAKPGGHYSHAVIANEMVYVSGQIPRDPTTGLVPDAFADQVRLAIRNVERVLRGVGLDLTDAVKITAYLTDTARFKEYNDIYREFFPAEPPARTTIGCQLVGVQVEIDCIAVLRSRRIAT
jgi:2-iminobutanoate/2-iminopropanoate deaminase